VTVREKSHAPPFLNLSLDINNEEQDVNFNLAARATLTDLTGFGSELRLDGSVGATLAASGELRQPLGGRGAFAAPRGFVGRVFDNVYAQDELVASYSRERSGGGADLGWTFPVGELRLGYETAHLRELRRIATRYSTRTSPDRSRSAGPCS